MSRRWRSDLLTWTAVLYVLHGGAALSACRSAPSERAPAQRSAIGAAPLRATATAEAGVPAAGQVMLDGELMAVRWLDGDTFAWRDEGQGKEIRARLAGINTLEGYGPVHQWGRWRAEDLAELAAVAGRFASSRGWRCEDTGQSGGYGRKLVRCSALSEQLLERGLAHLFIMAGAAEPAQLSAQQRAQQRTRGMWARGVPEQIVTSVHSTAERGQRSETYNRVVDTRTGQTGKSHHRRRYRTCEWACAGGSCMAYIPYERRYGKGRPTCGPPP